MKTSLQRTTLIVLNVGLLVPILIFVINSIFIRYRADDFCIYNNTQDTGVMSVISNYYFGSSGRFAATLSIQALIMGGEQWMIVLTAVVLIIFWLALFGVIRALLANRRFPYLSLCAGLLTSLSFIALLEGIPTVYQSVYWATGLSIYFMPLMLGTVYLWLVLQSRWNSWIVLGICALLMFYAAGCTELFAIDGLLTIGVATMLSFRIADWRSRRPRLQAGLMGALVGAIILFAAPGNYIRSTFFSKPDLNMLFLDTLRSPIMPLMVAIFFAPIVVFTLFCISALAGYYLEKQKVPNLAFYVLAIPVAASILIIPSYALGFYATGSELVARAWIIPLYISCAALIAWGYVFGAAMKDIQVRHGKKIPLVAPRWVQILTAALIIAVVFVGSRQALVIGHNLQSDSDSWDARDRQLRSITQPDATIILDLLSNYHSTEDVTTNPAYWTNVCIARYYGIKAVVASPDQ